MAICIEYQFLHVRVRLISGGDDLLLGIRIIGQLIITVGFGKREFHIGHGEWQVVTRNEKIDGYPLVPTARGYAKLGEYFAKLKIAI